MNNHTYAKQLDLVNLDDFREPAAALARARTQDVPTYAPTLYEEALTLWKQAEKEAAVVRNAANAKKHLEKMLEKLSQASEKATRSRDMLKDLVRLRTDIQRNTWERYYAPKTVNRAEHHYRLAIREAESGDLDTAEKHAESAWRSYREATLQSLERGPIAAMENQVAAAEHAVPPTQFQEAVGILADLRETLEDARQGDVTVSALRSRIGANRSAIGGLLSLEPDLGLDPGYFPPPDLILDPETTGPPNAPLTMRIKDRTDDSLTVTWRDRSGVDEVNKLERQEEDGPWEVVEEFGSLSGWPEHTDTGLQPDTRYCYRVRVESPYGVSFTPSDKRTCGYTRDGNGLRVWRVQVMIRTADVSNANTNGAVRVHLNSPLATYSPSSNATWLDYGPRIESPPPSSPSQVVWSDDFDRGREFTYDLDLTTIRELSDITLLSIVKEGTDALGIAEISLLVNGVEVFEKYFGETASTCLWIDEGDGYSPIHTIFHAELRAHPGWQDYIDSPPTPPLQISNTEIVSRLESMIGDFIHGTDAYWDEGQFHSPAWVEAKRLNDQTLDVDVDLGAKAAILNDPEIDLDFHLHFEIDCNPDAGTATLQVRTENFEANVDFGILNIVITFGIVKFFEDDIAQAIEDSFQPITETMFFDSGGFCPTVSIDDDGNINFVLG